MILSCLRSQSRGITKSSKWLSNNGWWEIFCKRHKLGCYQKHLNNNTQTVTLRFAVTFVCSRKWLLLYVQRILTGFLFFLGQSQPKKHNTKEKRMRDSRGLTQDFILSPIDPVLVWQCVKSQPQKTSHYRCSLSNSSSFAFELNHSHSHIASIKETVSDIMRCCAILHRNIERPDIFILRSNSSCDSSLRTVTQIRIFCFGHHFCADLSVNVRLRTRWEGKSCFRMKPWKNAASWHIRNYSKEEKNCIDLASQFWTLISCGVPNDTHIAGHLMKQV